MFPPVYIVLLHTPVVNRKGALVTTSVTNLDIHDIARTARTYGVKKYFIVTPIVDQHELVGRILDHWKSEQSQAYHPDRVEALSVVQLAKSFDEVKQVIQEEQRLNSNLNDLEVVMTDARPFPQAVSYTDYRRELADPKRPLKPVVVVFGTGWGIADVFYPEVHRILTPVYGPENSEGYNHLSVRSAVAIIMDRLFGY